MRAVEGFVAKTEVLGIDGYGRQKRVHEMMARAVGDVKAENLMQRIVPDAPPASSLEIARWLNPPAIIPLIKGEMPQPIAVLLVQLEPEVAAQVLHSLPNECRRRSCIASPPWGLSRPRRSSCWKSC
jgi:flagellar motor switch protein FliG